MPRRVVVTGVGLVTRVGDRDGCNLGGDTRWQVRNRPDHAIRRHGVLVPDRGRGQRLRSRCVHREKRNQEDGALHSVRHRGGGVRPARGGAEDHAGGRRTRGRLYRQRHRRVRSHRARASDAARTRSAPHLAVFHSGDHHQSGVGLCIDPQRRQGSEFGHRDGLHHQRAFHRRFIPHDSARRRRRHDLRRHGGLHHADGYRRIRRHARAFHAQ